MAKLSDRLDSTDIVSSPQSSRLAGFTDTTLENASTWTTADGVKQDRGWAYAETPTHAGQQFKTTIVPLMRFE